jgi:two-component system, NarL family, invasion response regulator UvrY
VKSERAGSICRRRWREASPSRVPAFAQGPLSKLTSREMEILRLLSAGKNLSEIAWLIRSSYKTVANTSSIMRQKLGVRTSAELVRLAIDNGVA